MGVWGAENANNNQARKDRIEREKLAAQNRKRAADAAKRGGKRI